jgi:hypothetical protein
MPFNLIEKFPKSFDSFYSNLMITPGIVLAKHYLISKFYYIAEDDRLERQATRPF